MGKSGVSKPAAKRPLLSVQVRVYYCDQWRRPRAPQQETPPPASGPRTPVNPVLTPKKRLATEVINQLKQNRHACCVVFRVCPLVALSVYVSQHAISGGTKTRYNVRRFLFSPSVLIITPPQP